MNIDCRDSILSEEYMDFIVDYEIEPEDILKQHGICYNKINSVYTSLYAPINQLPNNLLQAYGYGVLARLFGLLDNPSLEQTGVTKLQSIPGLELKGQGVLIGIIDTGIDYAHKAFQYADGTTKIVSIWDQTIQTGTAPEGIKYGSEFSREEINNALQSTNPLSVVSSVDEIGHGTFLAGIAAGAVDNKNNFSGVTPDAELIVVKLKNAKRNLMRYYFVDEDVNCYQENDIMLGITYLINTARRLKRPLSICIGLGTNQGAHDDRGNLSSLVSTTSQIDGIVVSIAAGNEGNSRHHYEGMVKAGNKSDLVEINVGPNEYGFTLEVWGNPPSVYSIDLTSATGEHVPKIIPRLGETREIRFVFEQTVVHIDFQIVGSRSGAQLIEIRFDKPTEGIWKINVFGDGTNLDLYYNMWLPLSGFISDSTYFIRSFPNMTITSPGNTTNPIVVTAYDVRNKGLYINASRGYTREEHIAPSIAAPGVEIIGPAIGNKYTTMTGTSVAAAFTTGVAAMILEWSIVRGNVPFVDGVDVKNLLLRGAARERNISYPNAEWGFGRIDIYKTFESLRGTL